MYVKVIIDVTVLNSHIDIVRVFEMYNLRLFPQMYDFDGDFETVFTGETDVRKTGLIDKYNGDVNLPQWTGKCANVHGASDAVKFSSYIQQNDTLLFFRKSLCRSERMVIFGYCSYIDL